MARTRRQGHPAQVPWGKHKPLDRRLAVDAPACFVAGFWAKGGGWPQDTGPLQGTQPLAQLLRSFRLQQPQPPGDLSVRFALGVFEFDALIKEPKAFRVDFHGFVVAGA